MYLLTPTMLFYLAMNSALTVEIQAKLSTAGPIFSFFHHAGFQFYNTCYFLKDSAFSCCIVEYFDICCDEVFCHLKSFKQELVRCSLSCYVQSLSQSVLKGASILFCQQCKKGGYTKISIITCPHTPSSLYIYVYIYI